MSAVAGGTVLCKVNCEDDMKRKTWRVAAMQMVFQRTTAENTAALVEGIADAARQGADVVLFPECATTGYGGALESLDATTVDQSLGLVSRAAREHGCNVLVGTPTRERGRWFNSLVVFDRRGRERFRYRKIHLTPGDRRFFRPGNALAYFRLDGVPCTAILCHERRYPELVRLPVMMGAQVLFHPNAGLERLAVSKAKRGGRDGIVARAFENQIFYVFANSVGPQGGGRWSAGDSKIVAPDMRVLALADNEKPGLVLADLELSMAGRKYAREAVMAPAFLREHWRAMLRACRETLRHGRMS